MGEALRFPQLSHQQWLALSIVNDKIRVSTEIACHALYKRISAKGRTEQLLEELWDLGLVINMGHFRDYRWELTDLGVEYVHEAIKPPPPCRF